MRGIENGCGAAGHPPPVSGAARSVATYVVGGGGTASSWGGNDRHNLKRPGVGDTERFSLLFDASSFERPRAAATDAEIFLSASTANCSGTLPHANDPNTLLNPSIISPSDTTTLSTTTTDSSITSLALSRNGEANLVTTIRQTADSPTSPSPGTSNPSATAAERQQTALIGDERDSVSI